MPRSAPRLAAVLAGASAALGLALTATAVTLTPASSAANASAAAPAPASAAPAAPAAPAASASASSAASSAARIRWVEDDMKTAMAQAKRTGKYILIDFTGSDWCGWCIKLDKEVFDLPAFAPASKDLIFAKLDFPRSKAQRPQVKAANEAWKQRLEVRGFPTIFLADAQGRPFAKTGYKAGGPAEYMKHVNGFIALKKKQDDLVAKAEKAEGIERAKLLGEALEVSGILNPSRDSMLVEIKAADPADTLGLQKKYGVPVGTPLDRALAEIRKMTAAGDTDGAIRGLRMSKREFNPKATEFAKWAMVRMDVMVAIDRPRAAITQADAATRRPDVPQAMKQEVMRAKAGVLLGMGNGDGALKVWDAAIALGDSPIATEMKSQRDDFAARTRDAG
ncbi:MAG: thioredoxin family protein [Phycisphaerales bacterium]